MRIACGSVSGHANLTAATLSNGQFTATASAPAVITSTLNGALTSSATSITLTNAASFAAQGRVVLDKESIDYAAISGIH